MAADEKCRIVPNKEWKATSLSAFATLKELFDSRQVSVEIFLFNLVLNNFVGTLFTTPLQILLVHLKNSARKYLTLRN